MARGPYTAKVLLAPTFQKAGPTRPFQTRLTRKTGIRLAPRQSEAHVSARTLAAGVEIRSRTAGTTSINTPPRGLSSGLRRGHARERAFSGNCREIVRASGDSRLGRATARGEGAAPLVPVTSADTQLWFRVSLDRPTSRRRSPKTFRRRRGCSPHARHESRPGSPSCGHRSPHALSPRPRPPASRPHELRLRVRTRVRPQLRSPRPSACRGVRGGCRGA